jgi:hypothetical protein
VAHDPLRGRHHRLYRGRPAGLGRKQLAPEHFGLPEAPGDTGAGHTIEQVRAFRATCETLTGYAAAVRERTIKCLSRLTPGDLDEVIDDFAHGSRLPTGDILARAFGDTVTHIGQICYIRGHLKGWGKYGR